MFALIKWVILFAIALLLAGFSVVNRHLVTIGFYPLPYELEIPVYLLILILFFSGFTMAWLLDRVKALKLYGQIRKSERKNEALNEEVTRLKHQPIGEDAAK